MGEDNDEELVKLTKYLFSIKEAADYRLENKKEF